MSRPPSRTRAQSSEPAREEVSVSVRGGALAVGLVVLAATALTAVAAVIAVVLIAAT